MNQRIKLALKEIQMNSNVMIFQLLQNLRKHISCLYLLCENIAELDILISFAQVSSSPDYVRPTFGDVLKLTASRHPILDVISASRPVPNDVFASSDENFHLITGPNMGGKSIYIRQIALLQIVAQVGCYVPARLAEFRLTNWLFSRIGFNDSIEHNASSFTLEMEEMQYISQNIGPNSLVIVDELGRSTSTDEGTAIAWAFSEYLHQFTAFIFFTTHLLFLTKLQDLYRNVTNHYMKAEEKMEGENCRLIYTYKLYPGVNEVKHYGLKLAHVTALPESILTLATSVTEKLSLQQRPAATVESAEVDDRIYNTVDDWIMLVKEGKLTLREVKQKQLEITGGELQVEQNRTDTCHEEDEQAFADERAENDEEVCIEEEAAEEGEQRSDQLLMNEREMNECPDTMVFICPYNSRLEHSGNSQGTSSSVGNVGNASSQVQQCSTETVVNISPVFERISLYRQIEYTRTIAAEYSVED